jgi:hypothetical protein
MTLAIGRRLAPPLLVAAATYATANAACSLDLDRALMAGNSPDASDGSVDRDRVEPPLPEASKPDGPKLDSSTDVALDAVPSDARGTLEAGVCATDADCQSWAAMAGSCATTTKCDTIRGTCIVDLCNAGACKASACDLATKSCLPARPYAFNVGHFTVSQGGVVFGVGPSIAAAYPFVFVLTTTGVAVYNVIDPTSGSPPQIPLNGVTFVPTAVLAVGSRVYFVSGVEATSPAYRQAIAWVDVPVNPLVPSLDATVTWAATTGSVLGGVFSNGVDGVYLTYSSGMLEPTANARPPLDSSTTLMALPNTGLAQGATVAASSGTRLVSYRYDTTTSLPSLALVTNAATPQALAMGEQSINAYGPLDGEATLVTGADGSVLWTNIVLPPPPINGVAGSWVAGLTWLLSGASAGTFDTSVRVTLESYSSASVSSLSSSTYLLAPAAWVDSNTALGLAGAAENPGGSTSVQVVTRQPPALASGKRSVLSVAPGAAYAAASNGFGYVLAADSPSNVSATIYVFAPGCAQRDQ